MDWRFESSHGHSFLTTPKQVMPTYDPKSKTKYFIDHGEIEEWLREQYDVPHFNVLSDLQENASPGGSYSVRVDGEISDYEQGDLDDFFDQLEEQRGKEVYVAPDTYHMTGTLMNKLAADGHIPTGNYVIEMDF